MALSIEQEKAYIASFLDAIGFSHLRAYLYGLSRRTLSGLDKRAVSAWEGLNVSPFATVDIPVRRSDGSQVNRRTSVADLGIIGQDTVSARSNLERALQRCFDNGTLSRDASAATPLTAANYKGQVVRRDPRSLDPKRMLRLIPDTSGLQYNTSIPTQLNPIGVPPGYPKLKVDSIRGLYPTTKLVTPSQFTNQQFQSDIENLCNALAAYLKSRNCNPAFHPVVTAMLQPCAPVDGWKVDSSNNWRDMKVYDFNFDRARATGWSRWSKRYYALGNNPQPGAFEFVYQGIADGRWMDSLNKRLPTLSVSNLDFSYGPERGPGGPILNPTWINTTSCDAVLDYVSIAQAADAILQLGTYETFAEGVTVDLYASCQAYNEALVSAYRQIGQPYGSNFGEFQRMLALEAKNRDIKNRSGALGWTGARLQASGDDAADIGAGIMGTVSTAIALGTAVGGPYGAVVGLVAGAILGVASVVSYLLGNESPRDPSKEQLRFSGGPLVWGLTPERVIQSWPVVRYSR